MEIKVGIFVKKNSMTRTKEISGFFKGKCTLVYLTFTDFDDLLAAYDKNIRYLDGVVFSGLLSYQYVLNYRRSIPVPSSYFNIGERDLYPLLLKLVLDEPGLDLSRVIIDVDDEGFNLDKVMEGRPRPSFFGRSSFPERISRDTGHEDVIERYRRVWVTGSYDLIVTGYHKLVKRLAKEGIRSVAVQISRDSMIQTVEHVLSEAKTYVMKRFSVVSAFVALDDSAEEQDDLLGRHLNDFNVKNNMNLVVRRNNKIYELTTSNLVLDEITGGFHECHLSEYLKFNLHEDVCIGWGVGPDIIASRSNAIRAFRQSQLDKRRHSYIVGGSGEMIGPLSGKKSLVYSDEATEKLKKTANQTGMSALNIKKISSVLDKLGTSELSSEQLAYYLGITQRSASRLLNRLVAGGAAEVVTKKQLSFRGRPAKIYKLTF